MSSTEVFARSKELSARVGILILLLVGLLAALSYSTERTQFVFDDAYITYRYSMNIADGYGIVWNPGMPPEEGYTSPLHVAVMVIPCLLMEDPLLAAQVINVCAALATGILIFLFGSIREKPSYLALALASVYLIAPLTWANAYSGMETSLFGVLILLTVHRFIRYDDRRLTYLLAFATGLARPEGFLIGGLMIILDVIRLRRLPMKEAWLFFALPLIAYLAIKSAYYGYLLPNPFIFKAAVPGHKFTLFGTAYVKMFAMSILPLLLFAALGWRKRSIAQAWILPISIACILLFYTLPAPLMGYHDRFLYSVNVEAYALASFIAGGLTLFLPAARFISGLVLSVLQVFLSFSSPRAIESLTTDHSAPHFPFKKLGQAIRQITDHRSISIATTEAGYLSFWSQAQIYDYLGLNTRQFALEKDPVKNLDLLFALQPDILTLTTVKDSNGCFHAGRFEHGMSARMLHRIPEHPAFQQYQPLLAQRITGAIYVTVLLRKDGAFAAESRSKLPSALTELGAQHESASCVMSSQ